jgi:hypothetical protein
MKVVIVFGPSGCAKNQFLTRFRDERSGILATELEREWQALSGKPWKSILDKPSSERERALTEGLESFVEKANRRKAKWCFLGIHAAHFVNGIFSSAVPVDRLRELDVARCLTIFDDLYAVRYRLKKEYEDFNYQQLLAWRSVEFVLADMIAGMLVKKRGAFRKPLNVWLCVKHPAILVRRLIFEPSVRRVYSAFSITGVLAQRDSRKRKRILDEISNYRLQLHKRGLVVFDPGTLDDRVIINEVLGDRRPKDKLVRVSRGKRIPYVIGTGKDYGPIVRDPEQVFPLMISHFEAFLLKEGSIAFQSPYNLIDAHITQIDLRYVEQADFVTVWRPFCEGYTSTGCRREAEVASGLGIDVIAYSPESDEKKWTSQHASRPLEPTWPPVGRCEEEKLFWDKVDKVAKRPVH